MVLNFAQQEGKRRGGHTCCGGFSAPIRVDAHQSAAAVQIRRALDHADEQQSAAAADLMPSATWRSGSKPDSIARSSRQR